MPPRAQLPNSLERHLPFMRRRARIFEESETAEQAGVTLRRLWRYFAREKTLLLTILLVVIFGTCCNIYAPFMQSRCVDIIAGSYTGDFVMTLSLMLGGYLVYSVCQMAQGLWSARLSQRIVERLRGELFSRVIDLPVSYLDRHSHGDVMSCMTNDIENVSLSTSQAWPTLCNGLLTILGASAIMFWMCWQLAALCLLALLLTVVLTKVLSTFVRRYARKRQQLLGELNGAIEESIYGYHTVVAYCREERTVRDFCATADSLTSAGVRAEFYGGIFGPVMFLCRNLTLIVIACFGGYFAWEGLMTVGAISAFFVYAKMVSRPVNEIAHIYGQLQMAVAGAERVFAILDETAEVREGQELNLKKSADIAFENVNFSYLPGHPVIRDFTLRVPAGKRVALVGETGCGKTTIANLLLRFYTPDSGKITINGQNLARYGRQSLRRQIAVVLQDTTIFSDTLELNVGYAHPDNWPSAAAKRERMEWALNMCRATEMVQALPSGYNTLLSGAGAALSQGERQLVAIARAFVANPSILIFDEATSNVDTRTERAIQRSMQSLMRKRTSLIIAHRLSTIRDADLIIVMDKGTIVEQGTHEELMRMQGKYCALYRQQFVGREI